jgi:hypothetical protein
MHRKRQFADGRADGKEIVTWLNNKSVSAIQRQSVEALISNFNVLNSSVYEFPRRSGEERDAFKFRYADQSSFIRIAESLEAIRLVPYLHAVPIGKNRRSFAVQIVPEQLFEDGKLQRDRLFGRVMEQITWGQLEHSSGELRQAWISMFAINLAISGNLVRLRKCACDKWFFAIRLTQKHCSPTCRKRAYRPRPKQVKARRDYMAKYMKKIREKEGRAAPSRKARR